MQTILLSGTHGVGKGYFLKKIKEKLKEVNVQSASSIISQYKCAEDAGYKKVLDINNNQDVLIRAILQMQQKESNILLDGHICLFDADGVVERIPEYFFTKANIGGIILLQDSPEEIVERLGKRDSSTLSIEAVETMQNEEERYAKELEAKHKIKCTIISHDCSVEQFKKILNEFGGEFNE